MALDHLKICIKLNPLHQYAYNNLAYIYNINSKTLKTKLVDCYEEAERVCKKGKYVRINLQLIQNGVVAETYYRHWAYALYKQKDLVKAIKKIKQALEYAPDDADNWVIWGLIMRTNGNFQNALQKFRKALELDSTN